MQSFSICLNKQNVLYNTYIILLFSLQINTSLHLKQLQLTGVMALLDVLIVFNLNLLDPINQKQLTSGLQYIFFYINAITNLILMRNYLINCTENYKSQQFSLIYTLSRHKILVPKANIEFRYKS